jgi:hypothetical protein
VKPRTRVSLVRAWPLAPLASAAAAAYVLVVGLAGIDGSDRRLIATASLPKHDAGAADRSQRPSGVARRS